jgi:S1-C subfamily serine protease
MSQGAGVWFVRARGRIIGPFRWEQLESLRDRGHFARSHQVSRDKETWVEACTLTELFGSTAGAIPVDAGGASSDWGAAALVPLDLTGRAGVIGLKPDSQVGATTAKPRRGRGRRYAVIAAGAVALILLGSASFVVIDHQSAGTWWRRGGQPGYIASHTSADIARATGLVVCGGTITSLKSGEVIERALSRGTCFSLNPRGFLLTNKHVVDDYLRIMKAEAAREEAEKTWACRIEPALWVYFAKDRYDAKVVYVSNKFDIAVLKVERGGPYFRLSTSPEVVQGTRVYAIGFPAASSQPLSLEAAIQRWTRKLGEQADDDFDESDYRYSITDGIVSLLRSELRVDYIQHSASISAGSSGGPLIYEDGTMIGINTLVSFEGQKAGVGVKYYAIAVNQAMNELKRKIPDLLPK